MATGIREIVIRRRGDDPIEITLWDSGKITIDGCDWASNGLTRAMAGKVAKALASMWDRTNAANKMSDGPTLREVW